MISKYKIEYFLIYVKVLIYSKKIDYKISIEIIFKNYKMIIIVPKNLF